MALGLFSLYLSCSEGGDPSGGSQLCHGHNNEAQVMFETICRGISVTSLKPELLKSLCACEA